MTKPVKNFMTRKQYLELPRRDWDKKKQYTAVIVVPTYKIHDSGFRLMALVGCGDYHKPYEIAAFCDDICWDTPDGFSAMDCDMFPDNIIRFHSITDCVFDAFCRKTAERTRIYADSLHETYAKKPWFKHCCKCCKNRVNYPVAGAICSMVGCAEMKCALVKKWIETRIK